MKKLFDTSEFFNFQIIGLFICILFICYFLICISQPLNTDDVWFLLNGGEFILKNKAFLTKYIFSFTSNISTYQHEWLFEVFIALIHRYTKFYGIRMLGTILLIANFYVMWQFLKMFIPFTLSRIIGLMLWAYFCWWRLAQIRPHQFSILFMGILSILILKSQNINLKRWIYIWIIFLLWVNIHSVFLLGIMVLFIVSILKYWKTKDYSWIWGSLTAFLITFINPHGYHQHLMGFQRDLSIVVDDWSSFSFLKNNAYVITTGIYFLFIFLLLTFCIKTFYSIKHNKKLDIILWILSLFAIVLFIKAIRFSWLLIFPIAFLLQNSTFFNSYSFVSSLCIVILFINFIREPTLRKYINFEYLKSFDFFLKQINEKRYFKDAVEILKKMKIVGNLYNPYHLGGYLVYSLYPRCKVFIDGCTHWYSKEVILDYLKLTHPDKKLLKKYPIDIYIGINKYGLNTYNSLWGNRDWLVIYRSPSICIYLNKYGKNFSSNLERVKSFFNNLHVPFSKDKGLNIDRLLLENPMGALNLGMIDNTYFHYISNRESFSSYKKLEVYKYLINYHIKIGAYESGFCLYKELSKEFDIQNYPHFYLLLSILFKKKASFLARYGERTLSIKAIFLSKKFATLWLIQKIIQSIENNRLPLEEGINFLLKRVDDRRYIPQLLLLNTAKILKNKGKVNRALEILDKCIKEYPNYFPAYNLKKQLKKSALQRNPLSFNNIPLESNISLHIPLWPQKIL